MWNRFLKGRRIKMFVEVFIAGGRGEKNGQLVKPCHQ